MRVCPRTPRRSDALPPPETVDAEYGLEPVFEPDQAREDGAGEGSGGACVELVQCPYCGESFEAVVDLSAGSADYIEDCRVCCQPIEFTLEVDASGRLRRLTARRSD